MAAREYQGAGGLRLHLDEPLSPQMADQIRKGHLVPVDEEPEREPVAEAPEEQASPDGPSPAPESVKRPNANGKVDDWRAYAVSLGMPEGDAADSTKSDLQDWVATYEDAHQESGE
ncbi:hypothetical protein JL475_00505 [Streptomyces sp. M2CJ-2]|uniref:hypothetical protein n=1 Tax=Streptomyces sp. M2CJ-2 TaxID=2803948 RepID=UPI0019215827|nr:hypothetical protein [Streptomyces sp. M2CJ-2]MBL3664527.1 hypothetical protein [Streptomyces sp. M2CJ-2]